MAAEAQARARTRELADAADAEAMQAFQGGEARAFQRLAQRHERALYTFALRMLGSRAAAEDATQEIFLRVVRAADGWTPTAKVRTWMFAIARNHCIDELRKAKHRQTESLDRPLNSEEAEGTTALAQVADPKGMGPDRGAASREIRDVLRSAIEKLPEDLREVFLMREDAGLPFREIAEIVGIPENTAKSRMRYALEGLRTALRAAGVTPEDARGD